ncbi:phospholipase [Streptomyces sp. NBC_01387]|uniref:phospholipase n=1 Tax=unclassified Streptomyces TaxID=2593676 RepID=UPI002024884E|nr:MULTISPECIES: phospholipase [unclassified Streptomyces]WSC24065.1 phospholipase [Streptomyces sp. NBC_01766]WSV57948.1 phospholipase [Streptomyces sp. NBC_01014]
MRTRSAGRLAALALSLCAAVLAASPAVAAPADKGQVLSSWTQTSAASYNSWNAAHQNQGAWSAYGFDWSTDYCSSSPDNPFGFPFKTACARHDFGYRNYKAAGTFAANKARIDSALYADLKRVCAGYSGASGAACTGLAWTYYQAVDKLGSLAPTVVG